MTRIEGKVAELLTERDLVINRGSSDGVKVGMKFKILNPRGSEIRDPDSREILGSVELVKVIVQIVSVDEKLSVGRTFNKVEVPGRKPSSGYGLGRISELILGDEGVPSGVRTETLRSSEPFAQKDLDPSESYVKRGDPAVQIVRVSEELEN